MSANKITENHIKLLQNDKVIGIIGLGDIGLLYARRFSQAGWRVVACDKVENYEFVRARFANENFEVLRDGHLVSRISDFIIYSVEIANIDKVVSLYGPSSKFGSVVGGQTSCKRPEIDAFEKYLPEDVNIITIHSLHGPKVKTEGQPLVIIDHRSYDNGASLRFVEAVVSCLGSKHVYLTAEEHDRITADTQAVTHAAFLSMGSAWSKCKVYPWQTEQNKWIGGIENVKINISLRIYSNKWHVYAGLAITNKQAHQQILQYATSATELYTLFLKGQREEIFERVYRAKEAIFRDHNGLLLLDDSLLEEYSLSRTTPGEDNSSLVSVPSTGTGINRTSPPNSHLSLLAIVDSWYQLGINPYDHMICSTPLFRIFLGVTEYLFLKPGLLDATLEAGLSDKHFRRDDLEFVVASREWSSIVSFESFELYRRQFETVQEFFKPKFPEATEIGNKMIEKIASHTPHGV